jgi:hypothetical protein
VDLEEFLALHKARIQKLSDKRLYIPKHDHKVNEKKDAINWGSIIFHNLFFLLLLLLISFIIISQSNN